MQNATRQNEERQAAIPASDTEARARQGAGGSAATALVGEATETTVKIPCQVYSRIVGYLRPVDAWNAAKQHEFGARAMFDGALEELDE